MRAFVLLLLLFISHAASAAEFLTGTIAGWPAVKIAGRIMPEDADTFQQIAATHRTLIVQLASPGGHLVSGIRIGEAIREHGYWTLVSNDETCASACGIIWLAGVQRFAAPRSNIGFHAAYDAQTGIARSDANAILGAYYAKIGMSYEAIAWMASAQPTGISFLNEEIARRYAITYVLAGSGDTISYKNAPSGIPAYTGLSVAKDLPVAPTAPPAVQQTTRSLTAVPLSAEEVEIGNRLARAFRARYAQAGIGGLNESVEACYAATISSQQSSSAEYCIGLDALTAFKAQEQAQERNAVVGDYNSVPRITARFASIGRRINVDPDPLRTRGITIAKQARQIIDHADLTADASPAIRYNRARSSTCQQATGMRQGLFFDLCQALTP